MTPDSSQDSILMVRLGAMGDILHTLPAAASLKQSFPGRRLVWAMAPKWRPLIEGNPFIDEVISFDRRGSQSIWNCWRRLRGLRPSLAIDFQGLIQSALVSRTAGPKRLFGFSRPFVREALAAAFYTHCVAPTASHVVERNLQLAASAGANVLTRDAWLPPGCDEGELPAGPFVLTDPLAGWKSKQWPLANYEIVAQRLRREGLELVANVPHNVRREFQDWKHVRMHSSSISGLIAATRRATAVLGLDSGPLHLAAALQKPGVALFGPTDPLRNGPYGGSIEVVRRPDARTSYKRNEAIDPSMQQISPDAVMKALLRCLSRNTTPVGLPTE